MKFEFKRGYSVFRNGNENIVFVTPHSGPAMENVVSRDDNSDVVANLCWKNVGGTLVLANTPRERSFGIDFNRCIPTVKMSLKMFEKFVNKEDDEEVYKYKAKYAWVAKNEKDYYDRLKIYQNFWSEIMNGKYIFFIHRFFPRMKAVPSIMDIVMLSKEKNKVKLIKEVIQDINTKYFSFFEKIEADYKQAIVSEMRRHILSILRIYETFNPYDMGISFRENLKKDLKVITEYADRIALNRLQRNFSPYNFISAVENAIENIPIPQLTFEHVFNGSAALGPLNKLYPKNDKFIIEIECCGFLSFWHPHMAAKMINDVVEKLKN